MSMQVSAGLHQHPPGFSSLHLSRALAFGLAFVATGTSIAIAVVAGSERGGTHLEQLVWIAVGVVLLLAAHLIPALCRSVPWPLRLPALALWSVAMAATGYGHATFFMEAQTHAGVLRANSISPQGALQATAGLPGRSPAAVAIDRANVQSTLARLTAQKCVEPCVQLVARRASQAARLSALNVEFDEAMRREKLADQAQSRMDRVEAQREAAARDPVTGAFASLLGISVSGVDLLLALTFGLLLEAVACLSWLFTLRPMDATADTPGILDRAVASPDSVPVAVASCVHGLVQSNSVTTHRNVAVGAGNGTNIQSLSLFDHEDHEVAPGVPGADLVRLRDGVESGLVRVTVSDIRRFFRCSQRKAMSLRRAFCEALPEIASVGVVD